MTNSDHYSFVCNLLTSCLLQNAKLQGEASHWNSITRIHPNSYEIHFYRSNHNYFDFTQHTNNNNQGKMKLLGNKLFNLKQLTVRLPTCLYKPVVFRLLEALLPTTIHSGALYQLYLGLLV